MPRLSSVQSYPSINNIQLFPGNNNCVVASPQNNFSHNEEMCDCGTASLEPCFRRTGKGIIFLLMGFICVPIFFLHLSGKGRRGALDSRRFAEGEQPDLKQGDQGDAV